MLDLIAAQFTDCPNGAGNCEVTLPTTAANSANLQVILQILFGALGAIAVVAIIIAVLRLLLSTGDPAAAAKFRNTIIYAIIGLIIALLAEAIVTFVLNNA